ncbi:MAG: aminoacetone oxidase family FAD-binding enzyme [Ruminococcaceae bacterium]|nr:aminoacetone oxidase family FAD-binding enzyme [Oscillospiraceae bacterium]
MKVAIIGGGASGLACAIKLAQLNGNLKISIYEKLSFVGKKILATGNGRCNLSNFAMDNSCYNGDKNIINNVISNFGTNDLVDFFESLGLKLREEELRLYPYSMNASSVREILEMEAKRLKVEIITDCKVESLYKDKKEFVINEIYRADFCILALGGKATAQHGTDGEGYRLLKNLGIKYNPISPALVQIKIEEDLVKKLKGVRFEGAISIANSNVDDEKVEVNISEFSNKNGSFTNPLATIMEMVTGSLALTKAEGEILFTEYGLSGIPVMQISGDVAQMTKNDEKVEISINFTPDLEKSELEEYLKKQSEKFTQVNKTQSKENFFGPEILYGLLNEKLAKVIYDISDGNLKNIIDNLQNFKLTSIGTNSYKYAQVTRGGVSSEELKKNSLESKKVANLFITGELLDVDGFCGGYNLHFAFGTGIKAAREVAKLASNK